MVVDSLRQRRCVPECERDNVQVQERVDKPTFAYWVAHVVRTSVWAGDVLTSPWQRMGPS